MQIFALILLTLLSCVGLVQIVSWLICFSGRRWRKEKRIFLVEQLFWQRQLGAVYSAAQWSADADPRHWLLLDNTLPGSDASHACCNLAEELGMLYCPFDQGHQIVPKLFPNISPPEPDDDGSFGGSGEPSST